MLLPKQNCSASVLTILPNESRFGKFESSTFIAVLSDETRL